MPISEFTVNGTGTGGNVTWLIDEQVISGDPSIGQGGSPATQWNPGKSFPLLMSLN
jgi:hypothetical protein